MDGKQARITRYAKMTHFLHTQHDELACPATTIIERLEPYVTAKRQQRIKQCLQHRLADIHLAMESTADIHNAMAAVRSAEALGIVHIHIVSPEGDAKSIRRLTRGAHHWVKLHLHEQFDAFKNYLRQQQFHCAGAVLGGETPLKQLPLTQPLCILLGNEQRGLSTQAQLACDTRYQIPMYGMSESFNLSVAAAISLYDVTQRKRSLLAHARSSSLSSTSSSNPDRQPQIIQQTGNLSRLEYNELLARHYMHTLDQRIVRQLLKIS